VAGLTARPTIRENVPGYLFVGSTLALAAILYLGYASFVLLKLVCILCLTTYVAVIGLFLVSGAATRVPIMSLPRRAATDLKVLVTSPVALVLALLLAGGSVSAVAFFPRSATEGAQAAGAPPPTVTQDQRSELERFMAGAPRVSLVIPAEGAKVLVVKFNDYQCPACSQSYLQYKPILAKYEASNPGAVRVVMRDYPLNPQCNADLTTMLHVAACDAAVAVRLARAHNRGAEMEEWLYTHQQGMTPQTVRQAARDVGMVTDFDEKYASTLELVKADIALGRQLRVMQTPTFFINGVKIDGAWAPQFFDQAIAYELAHPDRTRQAHGSAKCEVRGAGAGCGAGTKCGVRRATAPCTSHFALAPHFAPRTPHFQDDIL
jgi:protein-disulfide isomerase